MPKRLAMWGALALMALGLSGCFYQDLEVFAVDDFSQVRVSLDGMQARMDVDVFNPNPYAVTVTEADVKLYVNQEVVGDVTLLEAQALPTSSSVEEVPPARGGCRRWRGTRTFPRSSWEL